VTQADGLPLSPTLPHSPARFASATLKLRTTGFLPTLCAVQTATQSSGHSASGRLPSGSATILSSTSSQAPEG